MQVAKWGNSLAIRIPAAVAKALDLKEGDEVNVHAAGSRELVVEKNDEREQALARLRASDFKLPAGWKFDRDEANERR